MQHLCQDLVLIKALGPGECLPERGSIVGIPEAGHKGDVAIEARTAKTLEPTEGLGVLPIQSSSWIANDKEDPHNLDKGPESHETTDGIAKNLDIIAIGVTKASRVDEKVLLIINNRWAYVVFFSACTLISQPPTKVKGRKGEATYRL